MFTFYSNWIQFNVEKTHKPDFDISASGNIKLLDMFKFFSDNFLYEIGNYAIIFKDSLSDIH